MAKKFTLLAVLWIAAAFFAIEAPATEAQSTEAPATEAQSTEATAGSTAAATTTTTTTTAPDATTTKSSETKPTNPSSDTEAPTKDPDNTATPGTTTPTTPAPPDPCVPNPCGKGSTCEARVGDSYVCLCRPGESYDVTDKICNKAKVFPRKLEVPSSAGITYSDKLKVKTSQEFKDASDKITSALNTGLGKDSKMYVGSTVLEFWEIQSSTRSTRNSKVGASVEIKYEETSTITDTEVGTAITDTVTCESCGLPGSTVTASDLCENQPCDKYSTTCTSKDGAFSCTCLDGYIETTLSDRICQACPNGQKAQESECVNCPFGYSGLNCGENSKLILVIVGSVLGGLLLITLIVIPVVALKSPKKKSKKSKNEDIGKPYISHSPAKVPLGNSSFVNRPTASVNGPANGAAGNIGVPRIPRATSNNNNWDNRSNLEMTSSNSRQNLVPGRNSRLNDDHDDMSPYSQSRPQSNLYAQSRPQGNPYAQNRASVNPYAERQGQSNPYYTHDDGRRF